MFKKIIKILRYSCLKKHYWNNLYPDGLRGRRGFPDPHRRNRNSNKENQVGSVNILVVEDDDDLREVLFEFMVRTGQKVFTAANGKEALYVINSQKIDIVLSDIRMPLMGGVELLDAIKAIDGHQPKVLLATGHAPISEDEAIKKGAVALLNKPYSFDVLQKIMNGLIAEIRSV